MKDYIGRNIKEVATNEEETNSCMNEYGTVDYMIFRNIFEVPEYEWVEGISYITLEVNNEGIITHIIECL
jgi:hypothetical protein